MTKEELEETEKLKELFKKNFPEYVTEKGMCLSPFWDLFSAGLEAGEMSEDDFETIGNCLTGIIAIAERQNNEYTDVIKMLALQADRILYEVKEKEDKNA